MARTAQEDQFAKGVHKSGGQAFLFRQNEFNDTFTYSDEGVKKANKDQSIEVFKGYCWALCLIFIQKKGNFFEFTSFVTSAAGRGAVRGYQAMQHNQKMHTFFRWKNNIDLGSIILQETVNVSRIESLEFQDRMMAPLEIFLKQRTQHFFMFSMRQSKKSIKDNGKHNAHAICIINTASQIAIFDPNRGLGLFQKSGDFSENNLCRFIKSLVQIIYHKQGYDSFRAVSYPAKDNFIDLL